MREIVSLQLGQCGNQIGTKFWETICAEHNLSESGYLIDDNNLNNGKLGVYFHELDERHRKRFTPRNLLIDLEPGALDSIRGSSSGLLYKPQNFVSGLSGAGNNWAKGYNSRGQEHIDEILDITRKEVESCDCMQAFHLIHSLGGGTGSGLGTLVLTRLRDEYPDMLLTSTSVLPSNNVSEVIVEPYNTLLSLDRLIDFCDGVFCMDNEALYKICINKLKQKRISYEQLNVLIASGMSGVTTSLRFPGQLNADIRKLATNMIPFPRLHFFTTGLSPLLNSVNQNYASHTVAELTNDLFNPSNVLCDCNPKAGKYLTFAAIFRGEVSMRDIDSQIRDIQNKNSSFFVEWIPNNAKVSSCSVAPKGEKLTATFIGNNTALQEVMRRLRDQYMKMFKRRAFVHWYTMEGLEELQFIEAESNILDLISEYEQFTHMTTDDTLVCCCEDFADSLEELDSGFGCV